MRLNFFAAVLFVVGSQIIPTGQAHSQGVVNECLRESGITVRTNNLRRGSGPLNRCFKAYETDPSNDHVKYSLLRLLGWNRDYYELRNLAEYLSRENNAAALFWMGVMYHRGRAGTPVDYQKAYDFYSAAQARSGQIRAQPPRIRRRLIDAIYGSSQSNALEVQILSR